jgi:TonB-linked SusC/RagA family outer membrane protein
MLNYDNTFGLHKVGGILLWEAQTHNGDNFSAQRELLLPLDHLFAGQSLNQKATMDAGSGGLYKYANEALAGRINYNYADKYLLEAQFRYDGSSRFGPGHQWGFFPSISAGWRISEENFFKKMGLSFVDQLKLRASYGILGDDAASSYQFISGYNFPTGTDPRNFTGGYVFGGVFVPSADNKGIPNPNITWYTSKTSNGGIDFDGWNGLFGFTVEYFNRDRNGLLIQRTGGIPTVVGAALPQVNINSDRTFGLELELRHRYKINDFTYQIKGMASVTRNRWLYWEHAAYGSSWSNWKNNQEGRLQGIHTGYQGDGQFASWNDIYNYSIYTNRGVLPGDFKYVDWNGDGIIDGNDAHPISYNQMPWLNFSLTLGAQYKGFDLSMLWQGSALNSVIYGEQLHQPLWGNNNAGAMTQFLNRWHLADPKADPYDPYQQWMPGYYANTGSALSDYNSSFNSVNGAYLRLKSVELGYTLPKIKGISNLRLFINAYNILTITKVKYIDPEHTDDTYGYLYPLNKNYSIGLNLKF